MLKRLSLVLLILTNGVPGPVQAAEAAPARIKNDAARWITYKDYPPDAWRSGIQGNVAFVLDIDTSG